ncbi:Rab11 family-interacting protein 1 [Armadillidium nasatum]|uniref:Rab11 family-interacting protein 1 n=1 Tax=Armadillidium nasatum TaxID=96803 RepID=A0A5N5SJD5_9CRUS|nr:Rab11 family-interacting protein 1 [Armadillidium nasatum]
MWQPTHVKVTVKQAKGILTKGKNGTNDAFVVIGIGKEKYQTSIKEKSSSSVEWREECELAIPSQGNKANIQLTVYHHNALGLDEFLGQIGLPLSEFDVYEKPKSYRLKGKPEKDKKKGEKDRGELEIMVNFTVKSGSFLDISKKDKQKSSLTSLKHLGGSLMSIGGKDKREGLKNFAKSVSSKMDKIAKPRRRKSKTPSEISSTGFSNDLMSSQQRYGDADPGVISDDDDDDFKFDDDVKVNTRTSSPLSTMSRGSSLVHDQVLDTDYEVGSYEDPEHDFSYSFGKSSAKPPLIVDETKESVSTTPDIGRQAITSQRVTSFSNPNPLVRITPSAPEIVQTIIEEEPSFDKTDHSDSESVDNVNPVSNRSDDFVDNDDEYQKLGSIDLGPPIELPNRVSRTQDYPSPVSSSDVMVDVKTKKDPIPSVKSKEADISRSSIELSSRIFGKQDNPSLISTSDKIVDIKIMEDSVSPVKNNETLNSHTSTYFSPTDIAHVNNQNKEKKNTEGHKYTFEVSNSAGYIELETAKSDVVETNERPLSASVEKDFEKMSSKQSKPAEKSVEKMYSKHLTSAEKDFEKMYSKHSTSAEKDFEKMYSKHSSTAEKDFEKMYSKHSTSAEKDFEKMNGNKSSPSSDINEPVNVFEKFQVTLSTNKDLSSDYKNISQRNGISDEMKPKILDENINLNRDGRDSAISLSHDPDSIISSRPRSSSNASSVVSSTSTSSAPVDKDVKEAQVGQGKTASAKDSSKSLLKSASDLDVLLRKKNSIGRRDGKRVVSAIDCISSGDLEENQIVRSGSLTERRPSAIAAAVAFSADRVTSTPGTPPTLIDEWERKLYGRGGFTGSVDNVSMTGSRSSLNTSRESSIHDVKKGDSFTRLPEVKALTLEKIAVTEDDDGKKQKRKQKTGFKNRFFSKPENRDRPNEDSRIVEGGNDRLPSIPSRPSKLPQEIHDKFAGKSREDLLEIILNLQSTLEKQVKHSSELEEYIDNLLLRVMEATPHILQAPITSGPSIKYDAKLLGYF